MEDDDNTSASLVLLSKQYFVLPILAPLAPNGTAMEEPRTKSHVIEKKETTYLLLL